MTTSITLESATEPAAYGFPLDGEAPPLVLPSSYSLSWKAKVSDISGIPARIAFAKLSSGAKVVDLSAVVSFSIGTAFDTGKEVYGDEAVWGHLSLYEEKELVALHLHVSQEIFKRLVSFCEQGVQPSVTADLRKTEALQVSSVDGRLDGWRDNISRHLIVDWCHFRATLPHSNSLGL